MRLASRSLATTVIFQWSEDLIFHFSNYDGALNAQIKVVDLSVLNKLKNQR